MILDTAPEAEIFEHPRIQYGQSLRILESALILSVNRRLAAPELKKHPESAMPVEAVSSTVFERPDFRQFQTGDENQCTATHYNQAQLSEG